MGWIIPNDTPRRIGIVLVMSAAIGFSAYSTCFLAAPYKWGTTSRLQRRLNKEIWMLHLCKNIAFWWPWWSSFNHHKVTCGTNEKKDAAAPRAQIRSDFLKHLPDTFLWTDSQLVIHWVRQHSATLSTFGSNRISDIQEFLPDWLDSFQHCAIQLT